MNAHGWRFGSATAAADPKRMPATGPLLAKAANLDALPDRHFSQRISAALRAFASLVSVQGDGLSSTRAPKHPLVQRTCKPLDRPSGRAASRTAKAPSPRKVAR